MTLQSPQGGLLAQGAGVKLKQKLHMPMGYWQMVWEVRQSTLCCGRVPFVCPASFALCAGTSTPLGGAEPIHAVKSADPPQRTPIPPRSVTGRKLDV